MNCEQLNKFKVAIDWHPTIHDNNDDNDMLICSCRNAAQILIHVAMLVELHSSFADQSLFTSFVFVFSITTKQFKQHYKLQVVMLCHMILIAKMAVISGYTSSLLMPL